MPPINVLCATDENYAPWCGVMLTSLLAHHGPDEVEVYILTEKLSDRTKQLFMQLGTACHATIHIQSIVDHRLDWCPVWKGDHISIATYYRILAAELLPPSLDKILYLDCDIVINQSLNDLWHTDLDGYAAGVITDSGHLFSERNNRLGIETSTSYFNAGVILINLAYWRDNEIAKQCFAYIQSNGNTLKSHDQDTLNYVLKHQVLYLPLKYNFQDFFLFENYYKAYGSSFRAEIQNTAQKDIVVFHLSMPVKPWGGWHYAYPFDVLWCQYKKQSLWRHYTILSRPERIKKRIYQFLWETHLKQPDIRFIQWS